MSFIFQIPVHEDAMHKTHHELYLEPNTEFIIKARVFISFDKTHFSDWSEEYTFPSGNQSNYKKHNLQKLSVVYCICTIHSFIFPLVLSLQLELLLGKWLQS